MKNKALVFHEITPLTDGDCLYVIARKKQGFDIPVHTHAEFELNYIEGASGARRLVGDSIEEIQDYELILVGNEELEHGWSDGSLKPGADIFEITVQFSGSLIGGELMVKNQFRSVREMFEKARNGISFSLPAILKVKPLLQSLTSETQGFYAVTTFMNLLYELSKDDGMRTLASQTFSQTEQYSRSRRIRQVCSYIDAHYSSSIYLRELAELANMSEAAFSRFFRQQTGKSITDYIIETRIGKAARELVDTDKNVSEICYSAGFNNLTNFNRLFKKRRGCTPKEFRDSYRKKQVLV